jgi:hypothetical protein
MRATDMVRTVSLSARIPENKELHIVLPADVPAGPAEIVLVVSSAGQPRSSKLGDLADAEFFGIWRDRADIGDAFAQDLRKQGWKRSA